MAFTHSNRTVHVAGSAAEFIAAAKNRKYENLAASKIFIPLAFETYGPICSEGIKFLEELGRRSHRYLMIHERRLFFFNVSQ